MNRYPKLTASLKTNSFDTLVQLEADELVRVEATGEKFVGRRGGGCHRLQIRQTTGRNEAGLAAVDLFDDAAAARVL